jgi:hypothetical protein
MKRPRSSKQPGYEAVDLTPRQIGISASALFLGLGLSLGIVAGLAGWINHTEQQPPATALETQPITPPWPRLEVNGRNDRAMVEAAAQRQLQGYAWVDHKAGTVRIPIDRAMQMLVARGWPDTPGNAPAGQGTP